MNIAFLYTRSKLTPWNENVGRGTLRFLINHVPVNFISEIVHFDGFTFKMIDKLSEFDLIFNLSYGYKTAGQVEVAYWLEQYNFKLTTAPASALAIAQDKSLLPKICRALGQNTPELITDFQYIKDDLFYISKPFNGSCHRNININTGRWFRQNHIPVEGYLLQPYISGREFSVAVIPTADTEGYTALPPVEIVPENHDDIFVAGQFYGTTHKVFSPNITHNIKYELMDQAVALHKFIGLKGMSRTDFRVSQDGVIFVLDVNAMPNMHPQKSVLPAICRYHGIGFTDLIQRIVLAKTEENLIIV